MPIKGLTDHKAAFPSIGTIRKGAAKPAQGNKPGADLTYFRLDTFDKSLATVWHTLYPTEERARSIRVALPFKTIEENFESWMEDWVAGGLVHRCDGEKVVLEFKNGEYLSYPEGQGPSCPGGCKEVGRLGVILPELRRMATLTVLTSSKHDIKNLNACLLSYYNMRENLRGIPFVLRRVEKEISTPSGKDGKRARRKKWLLQIEAEPSWVSAQLAYQEYLAVPRLPDVLDNGKPPALPEPDSDWDQETFDAGEDTPAEPVVVKVKLQAPDFDTDTGEILDGEFEANGSKVPQDKGKFYGHVFAQIPFYSNMKQVATVLEAANYTEFDSSKVDEMFEALQKEANRQANLEAEAG